ncbi:MAG: hypothetical protein LZT29_02346 [Pantoea stewartii]|uniref:P-loop NTPase fold protein n=1 Tax=Pantoea stewartii TaxID=66269 RepID=UPI0024BD847B|nr:P-loop NTPase fold protein [Pantoea stewartii]WHS99346.1 MAG: hypothetical protein LZT29_02346 [Pantoea stewartii]
MSLQSIRNQILKFASESAPCVIAINGDWGVGKTFAWNKFLLEAKEKEMLSADKYSYVSLFGMASLENLKLSIFENAVSKESIGCEPSLKSFRENTIGTIETFSRGAITKLKNVPYVKMAAPAIEAWSFMSVSNYLVCIDDLERKSDSLKTKDIMGIISLLKEQKKCKVVLLLNEGALNNEEYALFREKVIDIEINFSPTSQECTQIAFSSKKEYHDELISSIEALNVNNIRVLKKIEKMIESVWGGFNNVEDNVKVQFIRTLTLVSCSHFLSKSNDAIPNLTFIEGYKPVFNLDGTSPEGNEKTWRRFLTRYGYHRTDDFDLGIVRLVKQGYVDMTDFEILIEVANEKELQNKKTKSFAKAWEIFHDSFDDNEQEVINAFCIAVRESAQSISPNDLDSVINVLRGLGESSKASELIDFYIIERETTPELFNMKDYANLRPVDDTELKVKLQNAFDSTVKKRSLEEVLQSLVGRSGWSEDDIDVLDNATEDDYHRLFKDFHGLSLTSIVAASLKFEGIGNASEKMISITSKVRNALEKISSESTLNKMRMKKFDL